MYIYNVYIYVLYNCVPETYGVFLNGRSRIIQKLSCEWGNQWFGVEYPYFRKPYETLWSNHMKPRPSTVAMQATEREHSNLLPRLDLAGLGLLLGFVNTDATLTSRRRWEFADVG